MATMSDMFIRGKLFAGESGLKTGADLEDLVTRAVPVAGTQLVDQVTLSDAADATVVDDSGNSVRRLKIKDGGVGTTQLADDAVTAAKLADGAVVAAALADGGITAGKIGLWPVFSAKPATTQSLPIAWTKVTLGTEVVDSHDYFAASRFTPLVAGYYQFQMGLDLSGACTNGMVIVALYKNGSILNYVRNFGTSSASAAFGAGMVSPPVSANGTGDYFEMYAYQDEDEAFTIATGSFFGGHFLCGLV